jgi:hypothetical protein
LNYLNWTLNLPGDFCYKNGLLCDHNHLDGSAGKFICSGLGGKRDKGSKYEYYKKEESKEGV